MSAYRNMSVINGLRTIYGSWDRYRAGAPCVDVTECETKCLQGISSETTNILAPAQHTRTEKRGAREVAIVVEHIVMRGSRRAEQTRMRLQVEVQLYGVHDIAVDNCACFAVAALPVRLVFVAWVDGEESDVVPLADHDDGDSGLDSHILASLCIQSIYDQQQYNISLRIYPLLIRGSSVMVGLLSCRVD